MRQLDVELMDLRALLLPLQDCKAGAGLSNGPAPRIRCNWEADGDFIVGYGVVDLPLCFVDCGTLSEVLRIFVVKPYGFRQFGQGAVVVALMQIDLA